jgi:hypothetical protein
VASVTHSAGPPPHRVYSSRRKLRPIFSQHNSADLAPPHLGHANPPATPDPFTSAWRTRSAAARRTCGAFPHAPDTPPAADNPNARMARHDAADEPDNAPPAPPAGTFAGSRGEAHGRGAGSRKLEYITASGNHQYPPPRRARAHTQPRSRSAKGQSVANDQYDRCLSPRKPIA